MLRSWAAWAASLVSFTSSGEADGSPLGWLWTRMTFGALAMTASRNSSAVRVAYTLGDSRRVV